MAFSFDSMSQQISIHQSKNELTKIIQQLKHLQNIEETLQEEKSNQTDDKEWTKITNEIQNCKITIEEVLQKFTNPIFLNKLKQKITKRKKKRLRLKQRNSKIKILKSETLEERKLLHKKIDNWIINEKEKNLKLFKLEEQTKQTEILLSDVTKKKFEANRYIQLLTSLKELRQLRKKAIAQEKPDLYEKSFENQINQLVRVWKDALNEYEIEEENLRRIFSNSNGPNTKKSSLEEWKECLFGSYSEKETIQLRAEQNIEDFIEIRNAWDSYIVPEDSSYGSSIPIGWVIPNEKPSSKWVTYQNSSMKNQTSTTTTEI